MGRHGVLQLHVVAGEVDPFAEDEARKKTVDNLFTEDPTGINFDAYEDIPVEATGKDVPPPISTFDEVGSSQLCSQCCGQVLEPHLLLACVWMVVIAGAPGLRIIDSSSQFFPTNFKSQCQRMHADLPHLPSSPVIAHHFG